MPKKTPKKKTVKKNEESTPKKATALQKVEGKVKELEGELQESKEKFVRLFSEFDNYKKRTLKERSDLLKTAGIPIIRELLPIFDDFERAIEASNSSENTDASLKEGVLLIYDKMFKILEQLGLKKMETKDVSFDSECHEAVSQYPVEDEAQKGKVIDEMQTGYLFNDKVVRYAKVIVGT